MPITVTWGDNTKSYVHLKAEGAWEFDEYHRAIAEANALINSVEHTVNVISHLSDEKAKRMPRNAMPEFRKAAKDMPDNVGIIILVPGNIMIQMFTNTVSKLFGNVIHMKLRSAKTLEEAEKLSAEERAKSES